MTVLTMDILDDEEVYSFTNFELVKEDNVWYLLSEDCYFTLNGECVIEIGESVSITKDDESIVISLEEYNEVLKLVQIGA